MLTSWPVGVPRPGVCANVRVGIRTMTVAKTSALIWVLTLYQAHLFHTIVDLPRDALDRFCRITAPLHLDHQDRGALEDLQFLVLLVVPARRVAEPRQPVLVLLRAQASVHGGARGRQRVDRELDLVDSRARVFAS